MYSMTHYYSHVAMGHQTGGGVELTIPTWPWVAAADANDILLQEKLAALSMLGSAAHPEASALLAEVQALRSSEAVEYEASVQRMSHQRSQTLSTLARLFFQTRWQGRLVAALEAWRAAALQRSRLRHLYCLHTQRAEARLCRQVFSRWQGASVMRQQLLDLMCSATLRRRERLAVAHAFALWAAQHLRFATLCTSLNSFLDKLRVRRLADLLTAWRLLVASHAVHAKRDQLVASRLRRLRLSHVTAAWRGLLQHWRDPAFLSRLYILKLRQCLLAWQAHVLYTQQWAARASSSRLRRLKLDQCMAAWQAHVQYTQRWRDPSFVTRLRRLRLRHCMAAWHAFGASLRGWGEALERLASRQLRGVVLAWREVAVARRIVRQLLARHVVHRQRHDLQVAWQRWSDITRGAVQRREHLLSCMLDRNMHRSKRTALQQWVSRSRYMRRAAALMARFTARRRSRLLSQIWHAWHHVVRYKQQLRMAHDDVVWVRQRLRLAAILQAWRYIVASSSSSVVHTELVLASGSSDTHHSLPSIEEQPLPPIEQHSLPSIEEHLLPSIEEHPLEQSQGAQVASAGSRLEPAGAAAAAEGTPEGLVAAQAVSGDATPAAEGASVSLVGSHLDTPAGLTGPEAGRQSASPPAWALGSNKPVTQVASAGTWAVEVTAPLQTSRLMSQHKVAAAVPPAALFRHVPATAPPATSPSSAAAADAAAAAAAAALDSDDGGGVVRASTERRQGSTSAAANPSHLDASDAARDDAPDDLDRSAVERSKQLQRCWWAWTLQTQLGSQQRCQAGLSHARRERRHLATVFWRWRRQAAVGHHALELAGWLAGRRFVATFHGWRRHAVEQRAHRQWALREALLRSAGRYAVHAFLAWVSYCQQRRTWAVRIGQVAARRRIQQLAAVWSAWFHLVDAAHEQRAALSHPPAALSHPPAALPHPQAAPSHPPAAPPHPQAALPHPPAATQLPLQPGALPHHLKATLLPLQAAVSHPLAVSLLPLQPDANALTPAFDLPPALVSASRSNETDGRLQSGPSGTFQAAVVETLPAASGEVQAAATSSPPLSHSPLAALLPLQPGTSVPNTSNTLPPPISASLSDKTDGRPQARPSNASQAAALKSSPLASTERQAASTLSSPPLSDDDDFVLVSMPAGPDKDTSPRAQPASTSNEGSGAGDEAAPQALHMASRRPPTSVTEVNAGDVKTTPSRSLHAPTSPQSPHPSTAPGQSAAHDQGPKGTSYHRDALLPNDVASVEAPPTVARRPASFEPQAAQQQQRQESNTAHISSSTVGLTLQDPLLTRTDTAAAQQQQQQRQDSPDNATTSGAEGTLILGAHEKPKHTDIAAPQTVERTPTHTDTAAPQTVERRPTHTDVAAPQTVERKPGRPQADYSSSTPTPKRRELHYDERPPSSSGHVAVAGTPPGRQVDAAAATTSPRLPVSRNSGGGGGVADATLASALTSTSPPLKPSGQRVPASTASDVRPCPSHTSPPPPALVFTPSRPLSLTDHMSTESSGAGGRCSPPPHVSTSTPPPPRPPEPHSVFDLQSAGHDTGQAADAVTGGSGAVANLTAVAAAGPGANTVAGAAAGAAVAASAAAAAVMIITAAGAGPRVAAAPRGVEPNSTGTKLQQQHRVTSPLSPASSRQRRTEGSAWLAPLKPTTTARASRGGGGGTGTADTLLTTRLATPLQLAHAPRNHAPARPQDRHGGLDDPLRQRQPSTGRGAQAPQLTPPCLTTVATAAADRPVTARRSAPKPAVRPKPRLSLLLALHRRVLFRRAPPPVAMPGSSGMLKRQQANLLKRLSAAQSQLQRYVNLSLDATQRGHHGFTSSQVRLVDSRLCSLTTRYSRRIDHLRAATRSALTPELTRRRDYPATGVALAKAHATAPVAAVPLPTTAVGRLAYCRRRFDELLTLLDQEVQSLRYSLRLQYGGVRATLADRAAVKMTTLTPPWRPRTELGDGDDLGDDWALLDTWVPAGVGHQHTNDPDSDANRRRRSLSPVRCPACCDGPTGPAHSPTHMVSTFSRETHGTHQQPLRLRQHSPPPRSSSRSMSPARSPPCVLLLPPPRRRPGDRQWRDSYQHAAREHGAGISSTSAAESWRDGQASRAAPDSSDDRPTVQHVEEWNGHVNGRQGRTAGPDVGGSTSQLSGVGGGGGTNSTVSYSESSQDRTALQVPPAYHASSPAEVPYSESRRLLADLDLLQQRLRQLLPSMQSCGAPSWPQDVVCPPGDGHTSVTTYGGHTSDNTHCGRQPSSSATTDVPPATSSSDHAAVTGAVPPVPEP